MSEKYTSFNLGAPRGMRDVESQEFEKIQYIRDQFVNCCFLFGFKLMEPSTMEMLSVLEAKSGQTIVDEIYHFKDKGNREVALRFDFTVGMTRYAVSQKSARLPMKLASFGGVWRYDEPQKGRYRYFHQWDIEIFGQMSSVEEDSEIIAFTDFFLRRLGIEGFSIEICDREMVQSFVSSVFETNDENTILDVLRAIDKIQKKGKDEVIREYHKEKGYDLSKLNKVLEFSEIKGLPSDIEKKEPSFLEGIGFDSLKNWDKIKALFSSLENKGVNNMHVNLGIVRGLDYYSGIIFEVYDSDSDVGSLVGGGRYDILPKVFGSESLGATGVAGGVERIVLSMEKHGVQFEQKRTKAWVAYVNEDLQKVAFNIVSQLRQKKVSAESDMFARSLRKQMEAASLASEFVVILGPREYENNQVVIRDMESGNEKTVDIEILISNPQSVLDVKGSG